MSVELNPVEWTMFGIAFFALIGRAFAKGDGDKTRLMMTFWSLLILIQTGYFK